MGATKGIPWSQRARELFIEELRKNPNVARAARRAGISRRRVYQIRDEDPEFAAEWKDAIGESLDDLEEILLDRAKERSDLLGIFFLKAHRPEIYQRKMEIDLSNVEFKYVDSDTTSASAQESEEDTR